MVIFHSYVSLPEGKLYKTPWCQIISGTAAPSPSPSTTPNIASGMTKLLQLMKFNTSLGLVLPFKDSGWKGSIRSIIKKVGLSKLKQKPNWFDVNST